MAIFGLPAGWEFTSAVPIAVFSVITAFICGWAWRYEVTWPIACCGLEAAFGGAHLVAVHKFVAAIAIFPAIGHG